MAKWDKYIEAALKAKDRYTQVAGKFSDGTSDPDPEESELNFDVIEVLPSREDKKDIYLLSGTPESLPAQISLFLALEEMITVRVGDIPLAQWIEDYESEFLLFAGKNRPKDNFTKPWGLPQNEKPRLDIVELPEKFKRDYLVCQYFPNRNQDNIYYWFSGTSSMIINQLMIFTNLSKLIESKDFGEFYGYPIDEYYRVKPSTNTSIKLFFTNRKHPPYYKGSSTTFFFKGQVNISNVDETKLTYENIRNICNGDNGLQWGHWLARAYVTADDVNAGVQQIVCSGDDKDTANTNLDKFLTLTKSKVTSRTCNELQGGTKLAKSDPWWDEKKKFEIYPRFMSVVNPVKVPVGKNNPGLATSAGSFKYKRKRLFINQRTEPQGWAQSLKQVLSNNVK